MADRLTETCFHCPVGATRTITSCPVGSANIGSRPPRRKKLCNRSLFSKEEADNYHVARRLAQQALWKLSLKIVTSVMAREDSILRDIREEKRKLRLPADRRNLEALELKEVARVSAIFEDVEDADAEARNEFLVVERFLIWPKAENQNQHGL